MPLTCPYVPLIHHSDALTYPLWTFTCPSMPFHVLQIFQRFKSQILEIIMVTIGENHITESRSDVLHLHHSEELYPTHLWLLGYNPSSWCKYRTPLLALCYGRSIVHPYASFVQPFVGPYTSLTHSLYALMYPLHILS